jgi:tetratricopeptide (TPR) repeat protein
LLNKIFIALISLVWALIVMGSGVAQAQSDLDEKARVHFEAGNSYYEEGDYEQALREFQRAYDLSKRPKLNYNISLTYEKLGDLPHAVASLEKYLADEKKISNRSTLELRLDNLRKRLERQQQGEGEPAAAEVAGAAAQGAAATEPQQPQGQTQPAATEAAKSAAPATKPKEAAPAETKPSSDEAAKAEASGRGIFSPEVLAPYIAAGVGAVTYAVFGTMAVVENGRLSDKCKGATCTKDEVSNLRTYSLVADIGLAVAVVGATVGTVLLLTSGKKEEKTVAVVPWISPTELGAVSQVRF